MKTIEEHDIDKTAWPTGLWTNEPDRKQWQDEATGLPCLIVRTAHGGNLCGYVGVPKSHPLHGKSYSERIPMPSNPDEIRNTSEATPIFAWFGEACREPDGKIGLDALIDVHGGLTYASECRGRICHVTEEGDHVWWFGFDCAHCDDVSPAMGMRLPEIFNHGKYRDVGYVEGECRKLAAQLSALA